MAPNRNQMTTMPRMGITGGGNPQSAGRRANVATFGDAITAYGLPPLLRQSDQRIVKLDPAWVAVTITDNATVNQSLKLGSLWDQRVQTLYTSAAVDLEATLHLCGFFVYIPDANYRSETLALKASLDNGAYLRTIRDGMTHDFPIRGRIIEPWGAIDFKQATAANEERALHAGVPWFFERPIRLDLKVDTFNFVVPTAINWATASVNAYLGVIGALAPRETPGAGAIKDAGLPPRPYDLDSGGGPTALGPLSFADYSAAAASRMIALPGAHKFGRF